MGLLSVRERALNHFKLEDVAGVLISMEGAGIGRVTDSYYERRCATSVGVQSHSSAWKTCSVPSSQRATYFLHKASSVSQTIYRTDPHLVCDHEPVK
jgi:hypothetical protein